MRKTQLSEVEACQHAISIKLLGVTEQVEVTLTRVQFKLLKVAQTTTMMSMCLDSGCARSTQNDVSRYYVTFDIYISIYIYIYIHM